MKNFRIGIIGTENSHAKDFTSFFGMVDVLAFLAFCDDSFFSLF